MLIECPACKARANLPDSHEGSKVRCGECSRVYVAMPAGSARRARKSSGNSGLYIGMGVGGFALIVVLAISQMGGNNTAEAGPEEVVEVEDDIGDSTGWDSKLVQTAVALHNAAFTYDEARIRNGIHGPTIWLERKGAEGVDEAMAKEEFLLLTGIQQDEFLRSIVDELTTGAAKDLVADWQPYDGQVIEEKDTESVVRVAVSPRDTSSGAEKRWVEWRFVKDGIRWKAYHWERWISPDEAKANRRKRDKGYETVTLSDGSVVFEREPEPLAHLADTPPELAQEIDSLYATMIDLDLTKESSRALARLVEIGRPAIPKLLTGLYETPLDTMENAIRANLIDQGLRDITGFSTGYKPQVAEGSGAGTTEERRQSAIKQWFAWWYKNERKFKSAERSDGLEGLIELSEKEQKWIDRNKDD